jgi:hypothetical protein
MATSSETRLSTFTTLGVAVLHGAYGGLGGGAGAFAVAAAALVLVFVLSRGWRLVSWLAMPVLIVALGVALGRVGAVPFPDALLYAEAALLALGAAALFVSLWKPKGAPAEA